MENWRDAGFGLYIHWPFCEAKCPYCDFNSHVSASVDHKEWREALLTDLRAQAAAVPDRTLSSIFFGGGTPSRMAPETTRALIDEARRLWPTVNDLEITLEANPTSVEAGRFADFASSGINRVSIGVQALRDPDLRRLGRTHDVAQALSALELARDQFKRVSLDIIYARQDQTLDDWITELDEIIRLEPDHVSLYQLTVEPGTVFARRFDAGKLPGLPSDDTSADMYMITNDILSEMGLYGYETSNHAAPDAQCRHNLIYWNAGDWLGVGPGAHGRHGKSRDRIATFSFAQPRAWLEAVSSTGTGIAEVDHQPENGHAEEYILTAIRLSEGLSIPRLRSLGLEIHADKVDVLIDEGLVNLSEARLRPTSRGRAVADGIGHYLAANAAPAPLNDSQS